MRDELYALTIANNEASAKIAKANFLKKALEVERALNSRDSLYDYVDQVEALQISATGFDPAELKKVASGISVKGVPNAVFVAKEPVYLIYTGTECKSLLNVVRQQKTTKFQFASMAQYYKWLYEDIDEKLFKAVVPSFSRKKTSEEMVGVSFARFILGEDPISSTYFAHFSLIGMRLCFIYNKTKYEKVFYESEPKDEVEFKISSDITTDVSAAVDEVQLAQDSVDASVTQPAKAEAAFQQPSIPDDLKRFVAAANIGLSPE